MKLTSCLVFRARQILRLALVVLAVAVLSACGVVWGKPSDSKAADAKAKGADAKSSGKSNAANAANAAPWNAAILQAVRLFPEGGRYSTGKDAFDALQQAVHWEDDRPALRPKVATPSFCSGGTYVAFLVMLAQQQFDGKLSLTPDVWRALMVDNQHDGEGVWGRWNANGPGTARLFFETGAGRNFTDWSQAQAGDFLKIFWNEFIGSQESGHSVIFIGVEKQEAEEMVTFWSSNQPEGYGVKSVPRSSIKRAVFSRLETPNKLSAVLKMPRQDEFLTSLQHTTAKPEDAAKMVGIKEW
jgi:hypothetical protein